MKSSESRRKVVVRMTNFPHEIHPIRPPGIETLLHGALYHYTLTIDSPGIPYRPR